MERGLVIKHPEGGFFVDYRGCERTEWGDIEKAHVFVNEPLASRIAHEVGGYVYDLRELQDHEIAS